MTTQRTDRRSAAASRRRLAGGIVGVALGLLLLVLWGRWAVEPAPALPPHATAAAAAEPVGSRSDQAAPEAVLAGTAGLPRTAAATSPTDLPIGHRRVRLVRADTGEAIAGATVWFDTGRQGDWRDLSRAVIDATDESAFRWLQAQGGRTVSDAEGYAIVQSSLAGPTVAAAAGGLTVCETLSDWPPPDGSVLRLAAQAQLLITVRDHAGQPVADVPLGAWSLANDDGDRLGATDAQGRRVLQHADELFAGHQPKLLMVFWPGCERAAVPMPPRGVPSVTITLPPSGRVELPCVDRAGRALPGRHFLLFIVANGSRPFGSTTDDDGCLRLPYVPVGTTLHCSWRGQDYLCAGPTQAGQTVVMPLQLGAGSLVVRGRLVDAEQRALAMHRLDGSFFVDLTAENQDSLSPPGAWSATSDATGAFTAIIDRPEASESLRGALEAHPDRRGGRGRVTAAFGVAWDGRAESVDLGLVVGRKTEAAMRGRLVDERGLPVRHATIELWPQRTGEVALDDDGRFTVSTSADTPPEELAITVPGGLLHLQPFVAGAEEVVVTLAHARAWRCEVLVDAAGLARAAGVFGHLHWEQQGRRSPFRRIGDLLVWQASLPRGCRRGRFSLDLGNEQAPLLTEDVEAADDEAVVVRRFDLRGRLRQVELAVVDPHGQPLEATCHHVLRGAAGVHAGASHGRAEQGQLRLLIADGRGEVLVAAEGFRPELVELAAAHERVVLQPLSRHRIAVQGPAGTEGFSLYLQVAWRQGEWSDVGNGAVVFAPGDGVFPVQLAAKAGERTAVLPLGSLVVPGPETVTFTVSAADVDLLRRGVGR